MDKQTDYKEQLFEIGIEVIKSLLRGLALLLKWAGIFSICLVIIAGIFFATKLGYKTPWTGFGDYINPSGEFIRGKTLWDWMELVIFPIMLASLASYLNRIVRKNEENAKYEKKQIERVLEFERQKLELAGTIQKEQDLENLREETLQHFFDQIKDLLLENSQQKPRSNNNVISIARSLALTALRILDPERKARLIQFLYDTKLIAGNVKEFNLRNADLIEVAFFREILDGVDLSYTFLEKAKFVNCSMKEASFENAFLIDSRFRGADLSEANLSGAELAYSDFTDAVINEGQLRKANTLRGARMPNGRIYDGRFALTGDIEIAFLRGVDIRLPEMENLWYSKPDVCYTKEEFEKIKEQARRKKDYVSSNRSK